MADTRQKDKNWRVTDDETGSRIGTWSQVQVAVLMDIRDQLKQQTAELQTLNRLLHCHNFTAIPDILRMIRKNTTKRRKPKVAGKPSLRVVSR